jgi:Replication-relaxation
MEATSNRRPRFSRSHVPDEHISLTERDRNIIFEISKYGFLRSTHIFDLLGDNHRSLNNRLTKMYRSHFLDKPKKQRVCYEDNTKPHVYAVGNRGASILEEEFGIPKNNLYWKSKNDTSNQHIKHSLLIADLLIALKRSCRTQRGIELVEYNELFESFPETTQNAHNPLKMTVQIPKTDSTETLSTIPDSIFSLRVPGSTESGEMKNFFYEADRGTMPVRRVELRQSAFYKKMLIYSEVGKQKLHTQRYNFTNLRILTVTSTAIRMENIIKANKELFGGKGSRMFLFTHEEKLHQYENIFDLPWQNGKGEFVKLVD